MAISGQEPLAKAEEAAEEKHREIFLAALNDCELVPRADPNTSSQTERYLKVVALRQMALTNQNIDVNKVDQHAMHVMGIDDAESYFKPPSGPAAPSPDEISAQAKILASKAKMQDSATKAKEVDIKSQNALADAHLKAATAASKEGIAKMGVAKELIIHGSDLRAEQRQDATEQHNKTAEHIHKMALQQLSHQNAHQLAQDNHQKSVVMELLKRQADSEDVPDAQVAGVAGPESQG